MNLYWGDIHNHCGISYGYGSLENALAQARKQLDFCAVTGHAMWPDIPERNDDTAFLVDFHEGGFAKLREHWDEVRRIVAEANQDDFVTFQSYEIHSRHYGDHHILSPDDELELYYGKSPLDVIESIGQEAMAIPHHIGYTPGYRGINWDAWQEAISPVVEIYSKHGLSLSRRAPYPYLHDMGPRDDHNTVYEGLRRKNHFGFVASTDHHAGFPGSYGDGRLAVWSEELSRDALWQAIRERRVYAVTGDKIRCEFSLGDRPMGSVVSASEAARDLRFKVVACDAIDKIVLRKNLKPVGIINGELLPSQTASDGPQRYKLRIECGWGDNLEELYRWESRVQIRGGRILNAEPCFRGRNVLAPSTVNTSGYDEVNAIDSRILGQTPEELSWQCYTIRNVSTLHPSTNSMILEIEGDVSTELTIEVNGHVHQKTVAELLAYGYSEHMKPYTSHAYKVHSLLPSSMYTVERSLAIEPAAGDFYHLEVYQTNGQCAFVSPIFIEE